MEPYCVILPLTLPWRITCKSQTLLFLDRYVVCLYFGGLVVLGCFSSVGLIGEVFTGSGHREIKGRGIGGDALLEGGLGGLVVLMWYLLGLRPPPVRIFPPVDTDGFFKPFMFFVQYQWHSHYLPTHP